MAIEVAEGTKSLADHLRDAHGLVHDISYNIAQNETKKAEDKLKELDMLLHDLLA